MAYPSHLSSLQAKLVVLGSSGVGKTSLVQRFVNGTFVSANSTIGAGFLTSRIHDPESGTTLRLQIWDTAGQERYRSISRLYYRGADAAILVYDVTNKSSFDDMSTWLEELKQNCPNDLVIHIVGTKADVIISEPQRREVTFERCLDYVAGQLQSDISARFSSIGSSTGSAFPPLTSAISNRSSGFWDQDAMFDSCHEVSAEDGEGIEEVFQIITRKLVEKRNKRLESQKSLEGARALGQAYNGNPDNGAQDYFDLPKRSSSFRLGGDEKRRSWLGFPVTPVALPTADGGNVYINAPMGNSRGKCC